MTYRSHLYPVSVKGDAVRAGLVLLLRNERDEWELPGGKLELGEDPARCAEREIAEETGWEVSAGPLIDAWQYHVGDGADVLVLTYGCYPAIGTGNWLSATSTGKRDCSLMQRRLNCECQTATRSRSPRGTASCRRTAEPKVRPGRGRQARAAGC